jgi:hypothetical protein
LWQVQEFEPEIIRIWVEPISLCWRRGSTKKQAVPIGQATKRGVSGYWIRMIRFFEALKVAMKRLERSK